MANSFAHLHLVDPSPRARRLFWHLLSIGSVTLDETDTHAGMDKPGAHLFWVQSGQGRLDLPDVSYELKPGARCWLVDMKTARATRFVEDDPMDSPAMQTYTGLLDEQYAQSVTRGHGLGLADALVRQIELAGKQPSSPAGTRS